MIDEHSQKERPILKEIEAEQIIAAKKHIHKGLKEPFKLTSKNGHLRASVDLMCQQYKLSMRLRKAEDDELDFSILLVYIDEKGREYIIRRYNGDHGKHTNPISGEVISGPHVHIITEECQRTRHKAEGQARATSEYKTFRQAINIFMRDMNIEFEGPENTVTLKQYGAEL